MDKTKTKNQSIISTCKNAILTQIWVVLCMYLLMGFLKIQSNLGKSMQRLLRLLQLNIFEKQDLMALLRGDPYRDNSVNINQIALL